MKFNIGDIISIFGVCDSGTREVVDIDIQKQQYSLQFIFGAILINVWDFESADQKFMVIIPDYIPVEQHERYRKMKGIANIGEKWKI